MTQAAAICMRDPAKGGQPRMVLLVQGEVFRPLVWFFRKEGMSLSGERGYAYALARLLEWLRVRGSEFGGDQRSEALAAFGEDLRSGTITVDDEGQIADPSGLWWRATSIANANLALKRITRFSDEYAEKYGVVPLNPERPLATAADQIRYWAAWGRKKENSLLGHLKTKEQEGDRAKWVREVKAVGRRLHGLNDAKAFPEELIEPLLKQAFLVNPSAKTVHERYNLRDLALTILCLFGGLRISEPLHLFVTDVPTIPDDPADEPLWVSHPTDGYIRHRDERTGNIVRLKRADYLIRICGKKPLTQETGRRHAGWKGALFHDLPRKAFRVFWIDPVAAEVFYACWAGYQKNVRPVVLRTPWAFLTKEGEPLGVLGFEESFRAAMRRIGVEPTKINGTTPHGLRHRYGRWFNELPVEDEFRRKIVQICLHHNSIFSQDVYRQIGPERVAEALRAAETRLIPMVPDLMGR